LNISNKWGTIIVTSSKLEAEPERHDPQKAMELINNVEFSRAR
jgi:hypothetical protein